MRSLVGEARRLRGGVGGPRARTEIDKRHCCCNPLGYSVTTARQKNTLIGRIVVDRKYAETKRSTINDVELKCRQRTMSSTASRRCLLCDCNVPFSEHAWKQHINGKRHRRQLQMASKTGNCDIQVVDWEPTVSQSEKALQRIIEASLVELRICTQQEGIQMAYAEFLSTKER